MTRPVRDARTGEGWRSYAHAARALGVDARTVRECVLLGRPVKGRKLELTHEVDRIAAREGRYGHRHHARPVECEDGRQFPSVAAAALAMGIDQRAMRHHLKQYLPVQGLYFRYGDVTRRRI